MTQMREAHPPAQASNGDELNRPQGAHQNFLRTNPNTRPDEAEIWKGFGKQLGADLAQVALNTGHFDWFDRSRDYSPTPDSVEPPSPLPDSPKPEIIPESPSHKVNDDPYGLNELFAKFDETAADIAAAGQAAQETVNDRFAKAEERVRQQAKQMHDALTAEEQPKPIETLPLEELTDDALRQHFAQIISILRETGASDKAIRNALARLTAPDINGGSANGGRVIAIVNNMYDPKAGRFTLVQRVVRGALSSAEQTDRSDDPA